MNLKSFLLSSLAVLTVFLSSCATKVSTELAKAPSGSRTALVVIKPEEPQWTSGDVGGGVIPQLIGQGLEKKNNKYTSFYKNHERTSLQFGRQIQANLKQKGIETQLVPKLYEGSQFRLTGKDKVPSELAKFDRIVAVTEALYFIRPRMMIIPVGGHQLHGQVVTQIYQGGENQKRLKVIMIPARGTYPEGYEDETEAYWAHALDNTSSEVRKAFLEKGL